ncbi:hypothetical protein DUI87_15113 [Hirundo rustica rustica]|uniref:Uncharacterized protein n=1 Tax=Hirundo rustica rustica TaxID=333673 RepID=A0A3M0K4H3_HIRRU|nr:hypothetical protein DUI87_15113 [Hirundo rustica rustica]
MDTAVACGGAEGQGEPCSPGGSSAEPPAGAGDPRNTGDNATDSASEASDSANTESRGFKTSGSSDSMDALEEDELEACSSSRPELFHFYTPTVQEMSSSARSFVPVCAAGSPAGAGAGDYFCFLQVPPAGQAGPGGGPSGQGSTLEARLSEVDTTGYYSLCYSTSPAASAQGSGAGPGHGASAQERRSAGDSDLVLRPPPGFSDSSSEEEFYDAADRLSPPDTLAGYDTASWNGTENSCIPKRLRCYMLGEDPLMREKHGQEKELTYTKSLRKRRSFLKTDYTSQVSFPAALLGSPQRCCSWPPTQPSREDTGKDMEIRLPVATQAQRDTAGTDACSDLMDVEPDTTETKSVMEWLVSSISNIHHPGDQCGDEDNSIQPEQPPLLSLEPLPRGQSGAAQESSPVEMDPRYLSEESCVPAGGWQTQGAQEEGSEVVATQHKASVVPSAVDCPSDKLLLLPSAPGPSTAPSWDLAQDQGPLLVTVEPSLAPCQESKDDGQSCIIGKGSAGGGGSADGQCHASSSSEGTVSRDRSRQVVNGETLRKVHEGHAGFPDAVQLLADCGSASGVLTRLSWLSFGVRTDPVSRSLLQDRVDDPLEPLACLTTSRCMGTSAVGRKMPTSPVGAGFGKELLKDQAWMTPADFSRFLAYTVELQEVVGKLCGNQATHLHDQCAEQGAESKGALGWASQDLLSSCQALLSTEQPLTEVQCALRATFDRLVHLAVTCFQVTHCQQCRQRQQELGAALGDVVGTYQQLVQALHQQLHGQVCPELGTKLLARQHTALSAAIFCLLQQFRASPWL